MKFFKTPCKILSFILTLCMVCTFLPTISFAEEENTSDFEITVNSDGETCTVTGFKSESIPTADGYELTIPETIAGYTVTAIGDKAFYVADGYMTYKAGTVTLPDTVKSIGNYAFSYCQGMKISAWPTALEIVGPFAFNNAKNGSISCDFSNTKLTTISNGAFEYTASAMQGSLVLPSTLTTIGKQAFQWTSIKELVIPDSVTSLGDTIVKTCASLEKIRFPKNNSITEIPAKTFDTANTNNLFKKDMSIYIPSNITTIPSGLFDNFNTGVAVTIYGEANSAAEDFYKASLADIENLTIGSISWVEYDFVNNVGFSYDDSGIYNGSNSLNVFTTGDNCPSPATVTQVDGVYGKLAEDTVYKIDAAIGHSGYNYINGTANTLDTAVYEFSVAPSDNAPEIIFSLSAYTSAVVSDKITVDGTEVDNRSGGTLLSINNGNVSVGSTLSAIDSSYKSKSLCSIKEEQWTNFAIVIPGYNQLGKATEEYYIYVNGTKYVIPLSTPTYGTRHMRLSPNLSSSNESTKTFYVDNFRTYKHSYEYYTNTKDVLPTVDFGSVNVLENTVNIEEGTTVSEFEAMIDTSANVRVYSDNTYETLLTDDEIPYGAMIVFATNNRRTTERAYSYYSYSEVTYDEAGLYDGTNSLTIAGTDASIPVTVTSVNGVYGKASDDMVYKMDTYGGNSGKNYLGIYPLSLEYQTIEVSFAMSDNAPAMHFAGGFYDSADASNHVSATLITITDSAVVTSSATMIAESSRGITLCEIKPEQWNNIAVVIPGYNQTGTSTSKFYIYVNGTEYEIPLATPIYGTRHLRFAPTTTYTTEKTIYLDNYRTYSGGNEYYTKAKDALPNVDLSEVDVLDGNINLPAGTTVSDFKEMISTKATVRVFTNDKYSTALEDSDVMSAGNMVVFATSNKRTTERTYSYYSVNRPLYIQKINLVNSDGRTIKGSLSDLKNIGEAYYLDATVANKTTSTNATLNAIVASYDADGKMMDFVSNTVTVTPGTTVITPDENAVKFEGLDVKEGYTLKAFLWVDDSNEPMCQEFFAVFDGKEEYHILALGNSWANDAFGYLPEVAAADGIDIYAVNMYKSGCPLSMHYEAMVSGNKIYDRIEYTPNGSVTTNTLSFDEILHTYGYSWDYITMQARATTGYDFDYFTPYITLIAEYLREESPRSEIMFHETWTVDTQSAKSTTYDVRIDDVHINDYVAAQGWSDEEIRPNLFAMIKANYIKAAETIGNPGRIVPSGEAINYAIGTLGIPEFIENDDLTDGKYENESSTRAIYRDNAPHLTLPYGRLLVAFTWYEYITGNDARKNAYTNANVSDEDMALIKAAAHYACSLDEYNPN